VTKAFTRLLISLFFFLFGSSFSYAGWCENAGGYTKHDKCFCPATGSFIEYQHRRQCLKEVVRISDQSIQQFNQEIFEKCNGASFVNQNLRCPKHLLIEMEENNNGAWLGVIDSPNKICMNLHHKDPFFDGTAGFEKYLHENSFYKLNTANDLITKCVDKLDHPQRHKNAFVAKYYRDMQRLKKGVLSNIQSIANIDSLLGNPPSNDNFWDLSSGVCENQHIELSVSWCRKYKEDCKPPRRYQFDGAQNF
jgi:hypothetical protein